jgi:YVTN family beta-propeller protein
VVETIQVLDANGVTQLDEPVGIAFASNTKAYVALSSRNRIAVVDVATYQVTSSIELTAQEPRAIAVRDNKLYVAAFESGNKSQLSACGTLSPPFPLTPPCTLGLLQLQAFAMNPNLPGQTKNIVTLPETPTGTCSSTAPPTRRCSPPAAASARCSTASRSRPTPRSTSARPTPAIS